jgi:tetratricopeptide (TPR) repeat protein
VRTTIIDVTVLSLALLGLAGCGGDPEPQPEGEQPASQPASQPTTGSDPVPGAPRDPKLAEVEDHWQRGMQMMHEGNLEAAIQAFSRSIELEPGHVPSIASRAITYRSMGKTDAALADVSRAIELTREAPFLEELLEFRGSIYTETGKYAEGEKDLTRVIDGGRDDAELRLYRAICLLELGQLDRSMADIEKALEKTPSEGAKSVIFQIRGRVKEQQGDIPGALADFERSVAMGNTEAEEDLTRLKGRKGR